MDHELYLALQRRIQSGQMTPEQVDQFLEQRGDPSFRALGQAYAASIGPTPEEQVAAESGRGTAVLEAVRGALGAFGQAGTLGTIDNIVGMVDPELGLEMEADARETRSVAPAATMAADVLTGAAAPGAVLTKGSSGLFARLLAGGTVGAAEGATAGFGHTAQEDAGDIRRRNTLIGGGGGGLLGGLAPLALPFVGAARRSGMGTNSGNRLAAWISQNMKGAELPRRFGIEGPYLHGGRVAATLVGEAAPTMRGRTVQLANETSEAGQKLFGRLQNRSLVPGTVDFIEDLRSQPGMGGVVNSIKANVRAAAGAPPDWNFQDAQRLHRRLREMSRLKSLSPTEQMQSAEIRQMADQLRDLLDASTGGQFSEANRLFSRTAEVEEAYRIGAGHLRREGETAIDVLGGDTTPDRLEFILEQFADNPAADDAFRKGLLDDFLDRATVGQDQSVMNRVAFAVNGQTGDRQVLRAMFPRGKKGDRLFRRFLREANDQIGTDAMRGVFDLAAGVGGRSALTRGIMSSR